MTAVGAAVIGGGALMGGTALLLDQEANLEMVQVERADLHEDRDVSALGANIAFVLGGVVTVVGIGLITSGFVLDAR